MRISARQIHLYCYMIGEIKSVVLEVFFEEMAEICCGVVSENEAASNTCEHNSQAARRKRMELRRVKYVAGVPSFESENGVKQARLSISPASFSHDFIQNKAEDDCGDLKATNNASTLVATILRPTGSADFVNFDALPKFGVASVCGRRRDMEDAVAIHPSFLTKDDFQMSSLHYFGVYDGHGCSHVG